MRLLFMLMLAVSTASSQDDPKRAAVDAGVAFPEKAELDKAGAKSAWHKKTLGILLDPALWASSLKTLEERTGLKAESLEIKVTLAAVPDASARGYGVAGKGGVELDLDKLAKYAKGADEVNRRIKGGAMVVVPPARTDLIIPHELTHCFQGLGGQPTWFLEGMACYVARDPNHVLAFRAAGQKVKAVDADILRDWSFARGWAFFEWLEAKHGAAAVKKFIGLAIKGTPAAEAAATVTGSDWAAIVKAETEWSAAWVKGFKP